jgi:uncharacterized protein
MSTNEYEIPVHDLDAGGKDFRFPVRAAWLRGALEDQEVTAKDADGDLRVRVSRSGDDVVVHGSVTALLTVPCARCLKPVELPIDKAISVLFAPAPKVKGSKGMEDEYEFSADEADILPYTEEKVVLDELVRDELVLETPMIPLCSEDCAGMSRPPEDRVSEEVRGLDPRLAPLLRFKTKTESKKE